WLLTKIEIHTANGHVHRGKSPRCWVRFLPIDGDLADATAMFFNEFLRLHKEPARAAAWVVDATSERLQHFYHQRNYGLRCVVLAALLTLGNGELAEEVFVHVTEDILCL